MVLNYSEFCEQNLNEEWNLFKRKQPANPIYSSGLSKEKVEEPLNILDVVIYNGTKHPDKNGWFGVIINKMVKILNSDPYSDEDYWVESVNISLLNVCNESFDKHVNYIVEFENEEIIECLWPELKKIPHTDPRADKILTKIENNITKFLEIYNRMDKNSQEEYIKKRPQGKDIIDGINIGLFSLKTDVNEGLNIFSTKDKPFLQLMKKIFSDKIFKRKLTDIEFKYHLYEHHFFYELTTLAKLSDVWWSFINAVRDSGFPNPHKGLDRNELAKKIILNYGTDPKYSSWDDILEPSIEKIKEKYYPYEFFEEKLNKCVEKNDIEQFTKIYNSGAKELKEEYIKKNSEKKDIIDGINIGLFSLKTE